MDRGAWQLQLWSGKELDMTEQYIHTHTHTHKERYPRAQSHSIHVIK